jgi:tripartite ATP-independent transporter DctM subunit
LEWQLFITLFFISLMMMMATGMPIAFCFMVASMIWVPVLWGWEAGMQQLVLSIMASLTKFSLLPLSMFILMGDVMYETGVAPFMIEAIDKWLGKIPGRLGLVAIGSGTLFAALTGSSMASVAMLGGTLVPEMEKRGYKKPMSLGPILGSGGLAIMIPPSNLAVFLGVLAQISIGATLLAIIIPGLVMAALYAIYTIVRCWFQPSLAPAYHVEPVPLATKLTLTAKYILPIGFIIFMVMGVMLVGIATPTEAAATGALSTFILAACYKKLNWAVVKKSLYNTTKLTMMMFIIMAFATIFSQLLSFSGAATGMSEWAVSLPMNRWIILIVMQIVLLILGMFINVGSIMMITIPIFFPVVRALGFDLVWFGVIYLLNMEMAVTTPPFGMSLFMMKATAPPGTTFDDVWKAGVPYLLCDTASMILIMLFPAIALWLPSLMR